MLTLVATPIGNLSDLSPRALEALKTAEVIACEDTRRTWQLLTANGIPRPEMISYRQGNEERTGEYILRLSESGRQVALCSDGGYPGISDPGYRVIRLFAQKNAAYTVVPGASAVDLALLYSGLPTSSYTFKGFPPRRPGALAKFFEQEKEAEHTIICFESPFRIGASLAAAFAALGNREAAVCFELTKLHEHVQRGYLADLAAMYKEKKVKGEITFVIAGNNPKFSAEEEADD